METLRALFPVALTLSVSCRSREPAAQPSPAVTVTASRVARRPLTSEISLSGSAVGQQTVRFGFMVAGKNLADTRLFAPLSGVLLRRMTEPGKIVPQGTPLFVLAAIDTIKIEASVPESELREVKIPLSGSTPTIILPGPSVLRDPDGASYVYVLGTEKKQAFRRHIVAGVRRRG